MIESLELIDREILLFINGLHADWLDPIMWAISSNWFWIPMVALFIFMAVKRFGKWCWIQPDISLPSGNADTAIPSGKSKHFCRPVKLMTAGPFCSK